MQIRIPGNLDMNIYTQNLDRFLDLQLTCCSPEGPDSECACPADLKLSTIRGARVKTRATSFALSYAAARTSERAKIYTHHALGPMRIESYGRASRTVFPIVGRTAAFSPACPEPDQSSYRFFERQRGLTDSWRSVHNCGPRLMGRGRILLIFSEFHRASALARRSH
jgi:hypothetical protein